MIVRVLPFHSLALGVMLRLTILNYEKSKPSVTYEPLKSQKTGKMSSLSTFHIRVREKLTVQKLILIEKSEVTA